MNRLIKIVTPFIVGISILTGCSSGKKKVVSLKEALNGKFVIGVALNEAQIVGNDAAAMPVILNQFNSITAENCMKSESIQPEEGKFNFELADRFVEFGEEHGMYIVGHVLVWHSQAPKWFFVDEDGNEVSREILLERVKSHITKLVSRYKGRVNCWDVVNEAILDDGSWRNNKFYEIIGEDYISHAFQFAHEADPGAELLYNDYSMAHEGRRKKVVEMVKKLQADGVKIDGIGMQAHCQMDFPTITEFEKSIDAFAVTGLDVHITEMDITVLPSPHNFAGAEVSAKFEYMQKMNPYAEVLPDSVEFALQKRYMDFFQLFLKHQDKIKRVTLWGVNDAQSWRNYWPINGRTDYPLLFDRNYQPKKIVEEIIEEANN